MVSRRGLWSLEGSGLVLRRWLCADSGHGEGAAPSTQQGREFTDHNLAEHIVGYTTRGWLMPLNHGPYNVEAPDGTRVLVKMARTKAAPEASTVSVRGTSLADLHEQFDALAVVVFPELGYQLRSVRYYRPEEVWTDLRREGSRRRFRALCVEAVSCGLDVTEQAALGFLRLLRGEAMDDAPTPVPLGVHLADEQAAHGLVAACW